MTDQTITTEPGVSSKANDWARAVAQLHDADAAFDRATENEADAPAAVLAALYDTRKALMTCPAPDWAAVAFKAKLMGDTHEDDGWEDSDAENPWGRLALVLRTCQTLAGTEPLTVAHSVAATVFIEETAKGFVEHIDGYRQWACNPGYAVATLATYVDAIRADARELTGDGWTRAFGSVWFGEGSKT